MSKMKSLMEEFNYYFDNNHGDVVIGNYTFSAADVLQVMDPVAYREEFNEWLNIQELV
jgi:hypothetical protein